MNAIRKARIKRSVTRLIRDYGLNLEAAIAKAAVRFGVSERKVREVVG